jgi:ribonuclease P protein subunit POP4
MATPNKKRLSEKSAVSPPSPKRAKTSGDGVYDALPHNVFNETHELEDTAMDVDVEVQDPIVTLAGAKAVGDVANKVVVLDKLVQDDDEKYKKEKEQVDLVAIGVGETRVAIDESRKSRPRRHPARMKRTERRKLMAVNYSEIKHDDMLELHKMWNNYIEKSIWGTPFADVPQGIKMKPVSEDLLCSSLMRADLHGSYITVVQSKTPEWVGVSGIVFLETFSTLQIITQENRVLKVLKANCIFGFQVAGYFVTVLGVQMKCRPGERSGKNFKSISKFEII